MKYITTYCRINDDSYVVDGVEFKVDAGGNDNILKKIYKSLAISYPKFHKMDRLSKAAFLGTEIIVNKSPWLIEHKDDEIALFFANSESSEYSDQKFVESYTSDKNPSPSQFVYTLPNILMGEIAIKHKWYGENLFLVAPDFDPYEFEEQIDLLLESDSKSVLCGWINVCDERLDTFLFLVEKNKKSNIECTSKNIIEIYNS